MRRVFKEVFYFKKELLFILLSVFGTVMSILGLPALLSNMIDNTIPNSDYVGTLSIGGIMLVLVVIGVACGIVTSYSAASVSMGVGRSLRSQIFEKVQYFSESEIDRFSSSSLITRTNNDVNQVQTFLNQFLRIAIQAPIICICSIILAFSVSTSLALVVTVSVPAMIIAILLLGNLAMPLSAKIQKKIDKINLVMREKLTGVRVIRAFGATEFESDKFNNINLEYKRDNKKMQRITNAIVPTLSLIIPATSSSLLILSYIKHYQGESFTIGEVVSVLQYVLQIMYSVSMLTVIFVLLPRVVTAANRADEVLRTVPSIIDKENTKDSTDKKGYLEFKNVSFMYKDANEPIIKNLSFKSKPGETTAIIGGTGTGKSTIVNLIPRLYDVTEGEILIDDVDIRDYSLESLRAKIGFVPQKAVLFTGTIDSNIRFGDKNITEDEIEEAAKIAQAYDFIIKKDDGFNSKISQGGTNVSGGQRQRLAIARAIVRKPEIYIFDDSFSALDFKTDKSLRMALSKEIKNATTIIVAQRVSTIMDADRIIVIDNNEVVGIGTHNELLKNCDVYKEIVNSQIRQEEV